MKTRTPVLIFFAAVTILLFVNQVAYAQSSQVSTVVNLSHLNVQLTYPSQVQPGQSVTVNVQAKAKGSFKLGSLIMQIYVPGQNNLRQVTSATVAEGLSMLTGDQINRNIQVTVPQDTPRTSLIAKLSENVTLAIFIIYNNASPSVQPAPYYTAVSDDAITPLTYVMATTPEYSTLQSQFHALQLNFNKLQQTLNQTQSTISQQNATINQLNQQFYNQLTYANRRIQTYQGLSLGLSFVTVALAIVCIYQRTSRRETQGAVKNIPVANPAKREALESTLKRKLNLK